MTICCRFGQGITAVAVVTCGYVVALRLNARPAGPEGDAGSSSLDLLGLELGLWRLLLWSSQVRERQRVRSVTPHPGAARPTRRPQGHFLFLAAGKITEHNLTPVPEALCCPLDVCHYQGLSFVKLNIYFTKTQTQIWFLKFGEHSHTHTHLSCYLCEDLPSYDAFPSR